MTILVAQVDQHAAVIPEWVTDLQSFRQWAFSDEFPQSGWYSHLDGNLWVDTSMERVTHNKLKGKIGAVLNNLVEPPDMGQFFYDRMLLTHVEAGISTEPDGMYVSHDGLTGGRVKLERGAESLEVEGTPDMVVEVVSPTSRQKDRKVLFELYHRAGIAEYWIVEQYKDDIMFDLFVWQREGYAPAPAVEGWTQSPVFGRKFQFRITNDRSGYPVYHLDVESAR